MLELSIQQRWCRSGVTVGPTTVAQDPNGYGAFAPDVGVPRTSFLGVYRASHWRKGFLRPYNGSNEYVMQVGRWRAYPGGWNGNVDVVQYPTQQYSSPKSWVKTWHLTEDLGSAQVFTQVLGQVQL